MDATIPDTHHPTEDVWLHPGAKWPVPLHQQSVERARGEKSPTNPSSLYTRTCKQVQFAQYGQNMITHFWWRNCITIFIHLSCQNTSQIIAHWQAYEWLQPPLYFCTFKSIIKHMAPWINDDTALIKENVERPEGGTGKQGFMYIIQIWKSQFLLLLSFKYLQIHFITSRESNNLMPSCLTLSNRRAQKAGDKKWF